MIYRNSSDTGLFGSHELRDLIEKNINAATNEVAKMGADVFEANGDEQIADHVCSKYRLIPLALLEDQKDVQFTEKKIDVSGDPSRVFFANYEPLFIDGYRVTWTMPFTGTERLFYSQPSTYTLLRIPGDINQNFITLATELPADNSDVQKLKIVCKISLKALKK